MNYLYSYQGSSSVALIYSDNSPDIFGPNDYNSFVIICEINIILMLDLNFKVDLIDCNFLFN